MFIIYHEYVPRGFLVGPFLPIYGFGSIIFLLIFGDKKHKNTYIFIMGLVFATLLEYFTGSILEVFFHKSLWSYADAPLNFQGKISLISSLGFGLGALIIMRIIKPLVELFIKKTPKLISHTLALALMMYLFIDFLVSSINP